MEQFLTWVENTTERYLTKRKARKAYEKGKKWTLLGEIWSWVDALIFGVFWVIIINQFLFQLFVIPSPSMVSTLLVGDRVVVNKDAYGVEIYPGGPKVFADNNRVQRDDIITFYNPEYESKGPFFDILSQAVFMGTLTLVNIDKNADGTMAERLYVKRAAGIGGDQIRFVDGNVLIKAGGSDEFVTEESFRADNNLSSGPNRSVPADKYAGLKAAARLGVYNDLGIGFPSYLVNEYKSIANTEWDYRFDIYEYRHQFAAMETQVDPSNMSYRSELGKYEAGIYVPTGYVLPLGDNRDNSQDGRYFGPVKESRFNGHVIARFLPISRRAILTDD
ncbi:MAG: signal peptidase I [Spirochaetales bacterium]|nr:signal peptidase I [Candidatus Physcosoma equi]